MADEPASPAPKAPAAAASSADEAGGVSSPLLRNDMRRDVRAQRHIHVDRACDSSVYADLVVGPDFWASVMRRYNTAIVEQRPQSATLLRAHMAHHVAQQETPEAAVVARFSDATGYIPAACAAGALAALGADCTERVAQSVVEQCAGSGSSGLSEHQFTVLAEAIRSVASQQVIAARLRSRTPERDAAIRASLNRDLSRPTDPEGYSRTSSAAGTASRRGRSPSVAGRASSAAYRRPSPSRTVGSVGSARSGTHTLKSLASLHHSQRQRAEAEMQSERDVLLARSRSRSPGSVSVGTANARRSRSIPPAAAGVTPTRAEKRPKPGVPEPSLSTVNVRDLRAARQKPRGSTVRNAIGTTQPRLTVNRFDVPTLRFS